MHIQHSIFHPHRWLIAILLLSVLLRVGTALYLGDAITDIRGGTHDQISYDALAQRVATGHGFSFATDWWPNTRADQPTAFWSYLYTLSLAGIYTAVGHHPLAARLIQAVLVGLAMPWLTYRLARRVFGSPSPLQERGPGGEVTALIAAAITAIYLYFVIYAASLMTEALYIIGILWITDLTMRLAEAGGETTSRRRAWLGVELGLALAITLLLRQVAAVFYPLLALWLLWLARRQGWLRGALSTLVVAGTVAVVVISPFIMRNYRVFGQLAMPNTNAGFAFFWANHPIYGTRFTATLSPELGVSYQELIPPELRDLNEAALDRALLARGLAFIADDPDRYLLLSLSRIPVYFQFWPTRDSTLLSNASRVLSFGIFLPFMIYGLILAIRRVLKTKAAPLPSQGGGWGVGDQSSKPHINSDLQPAYVALFLLFIASYTAVHLASWANVRYRLPVDAFLILFAAYGIENLALTLWGRRGV